MCWSAAELCVRACACVHAPGFFFKSYERPWYFFEAIDMIRKFLLVAGLALFEQGSPVQLLVRGTNFWRRWWAASQQSPGASSSASFALSALCCRWFVLAAGAIDLPDLPRHGPQRGSVRVAAPQRGNRSAARNEG